MDTLLKRLVAPLLSLCIGACGSETPPPAHLSPEDTVLHWQAWIDCNQYDSARLYSTENVRPFIDFLASITFGDTSACSLTLLRDLRCEVAGDSAVCIFATKDEIGRDVIDTIVLRRSPRNIWLVDGIGMSNLPFDSLLKGQENLVFPPNADEEIE
ncbi:MAG: hypothetical protein ACK4NS_08135 [Saprospiraceae bacterium]